AFSSGCFGRSRGRSATEPSLRPIRSRWRDKHHSIPALSPRTQKLRDDHASRNASTTGILAALSAGNRPPIKPTTQAHITPLTRTSGVTLSSKTVTDVVLPMLTVLPPHRRKATPAPDVAPTIASRNASTSTETTIPVGPKPRARNVAISTLRWLTDEYMVFNAASTAPTAMIATTTLVTMSISKDNVRDCRR